MEQKEQQDFQRLVFENRERLKELNAINKTTSIISENKPIAETLKNICDILPPAMQFPEKASARICYNKLTIPTSDFAEGINNSIRKDFASIDSIGGHIEIQYSGFDEKDGDSMFLKEEYNLLDNITSLVTGYINSYKARQVFSNIGTKDQPVDVFSKDTSPDKSLQLFQRYLYRQNANRDVFHDLMPFKVREILLVSTFYDAFSIEKEGRFAEHVLGIYQQYNLSSFPRITGVSTEEEIFSQLQRKHFDLIIYMIGAEVKTPFDICTRIKNEYPYIPVYFLVNNKTFHADVIALELTSLPYDKTFYWNGEPSVFFAMVKHLEDKVNVDNDTRLAMVRVILLVEDDPRYYSRYLPLLHSIVLEQTRRIIDDVTTDELYKILKLRGRPKILLAADYEEAQKIVEKYDEYLLCLITDVKFEKEGKLTSDAGFQLVRSLRERNADLPVIIQSSDMENSVEAYRLKSTFINKNSETLISEIRSFIGHYLGFGNFTYRTPDGKEIATARTLREFEMHLKNIPDDSLLYHARRNHFSSWLMARGEIQAARILSPKRVSDFSSVDDMRTCLLHTIQEYRNEQNKGRIVNLEDVDYFEEGNIISLGSGSIGGKGRGISFINSLIYSFDFSNSFGNINLKMPRTAVIGVDEFENFMVRNHLWEVALNDNFSMITQQFIDARLSEGLMKKLKKLLRMIDKPIAVRSSGLFEDSMRQPFAGIFETYLLPNSHPDYDVRLKQLCDAIKMVYASVYANVAKGYFEAVNYKIEEEKMAIVLQEVVGNQYEHYYYPHISGVAQSYNYYPVSDMKPEDGVAVSAVGLGKYVVEGERAYRFSPVMPNVEINSLKDIVKNSQVDFYAVDLAKQEIDLTEGDTAGLVRIDIWDAERHGNLKHCASVFDPENNSMSPGLDKNGPRIVNFANIFKYNYIPLTSTISVLLNIIRESMGSPVEIEYAVDLTPSEGYKASFYLLQIKPLIGDNRDFSIDRNDLKMDELILFAEKSMGNGRIANIEDIVFVKYENFDKTRTVEIAEEIEKLNKQLGAENRKYLLIGPGRWGSRDRFIGIPVVWNQISNAKAIVETGHEDFPLDASMGSHFFHNVTSLNIGYFTVDGISKSGLINWGIIEKQEIITDLEFTRHVRFKKPLSIHMDGKNRIAAISE
ncbi:hypothetical protein SDC9_51019 [bioreactor metagenome]|uniref:Pyruvate phosphate dikinase AMP/ATP-binding domain-containing protein n=1 Tax=bioreactor metagenome TaxID=1076179 RepID=A0A644WLT7_9ZZZZ